MRALNELYISVSKKNKRNEKYSVRRAASAKNGVVKGG
jgi:hypothetical protein